MAIARIGDITSLMVSCFEVALNCFETMFYKTSKFTILSNIKYEQIIGPKTWVDVYQNCGGELQSPINLGIDSAAVYARTMEDLGRIKFSDAYKGITEGKLHNNGHTGK